MQLVRIIRYSAVLLFIVVVVFLGASVATKSSIGMALLENLKRTFRGETAQTRFMSYATKITPLSRLEVAKLEQIEVFDRASDVKVFWEFFSLPQVVVRVTLPVEYRYYVEFKDNWHVELKDHLLMVTVPVLEAGTPAPNISALQYEIRQGSFFRSENSVALALRQELTSLLEKRAHDNVSLVRETARHQISEFAKKWLNSEATSAEVMVRFADEITPVKTM